MRHRVARAGLAGLLLLVVSACGDPAGGPEPLGDREVLDAAVVPARPLTLADTEPPTTGRG